MFDRNIINFFYKNINLTAITIFLIIISIIVLNKPRFIYDKDGIPMQFGIGYRNKTIFPIWLVIIISAIVSYYIVLYLANINKLNF